MLGDHELIWYSQWSIIHIFCLSTFLWTPIYYYCEPFILFFQVTSPKRKKKGTFISGTVDIDDLLAKEQTPTNFALDDSLGSPAPPPVQNGVQENGYIKKHVDFSEPELVISKTNDQEEKPWWTASNGDETLFAGKILLLSFFIFFTWLLHNTYSNFTTIFFITPKHRKTTP